MDYILETNALKKSYKKYNVLKGADMHIPRGAIYGLVGKNGAGKTTLMRIICGLQRPSEGSYCIYGVKYNDRAIKKSRRRMGAMVETPSLYLDMTAYENIIQQYKLMGLYEYKEAERLLELVALEHTKDKTVRKFSLGMRQRLGIAVALAGRPDFLVLDEPVNGLDPEGIVEIRELLLRLNREEQITILISSHILDELSRLATHYGFMRDGKIVKEMTAAEMEKNSRKCKCIEVSDIKLFCRAMDIQGAEYDIIGKNTVNLYGAFDITELVMLLSGEGCRVISVQDRDEGLENVFLTLSGGGSNE